MNLDGTPILITRPEPQARGMAALVSASNGYPIVQPGAEIVAAADDEPSLSALADVSRYDAVIFSSVHAVTHFARRVPRREWPEGMRLVAMGEGSAGALRSLGASTVETPAEGVGSQALLEGFDTAGLKRVLVVAPEDGRRVVDEALQGKGIEVVRAHVYSRAAPQLNPQAARAVRTHWPRLIVTATSHRLLTNVVELLNERDLRTRPLVVASERQRDAARALGFAEIAVAERPNDSAVIARCERFIGKTFGSEMNND